MQAGSARNMSDRAIVREARRSHARKCSILLAVLAVLFFASLPMGGTAAVFHSFGEVADALLLWVRVSFDGTVNHIQYSTKDILDQCPAYFQVLSRLAITGIAIACGAMTALSGALYQMVFRNPIAAPTMLGVGNGVTLGVVALVLVFEGAAPFLTGFRYLFCYAGATIVLALVIGLALLIGKGRLVVVDMLLVGSVVSALAGQAIIFVTYCIFDEDAWDVFTAINEMLTVNTEPISLIVLAVALIVSIAPIALLRFKLNVVAFDEADMRLSGINPTALRGIALACATVMIISAQTHIGTIAIIALIAPYAARTWFGAEFSKQFWGAILIGAILVLACTDLSDFIGILLINNGIVLSFPVGLAANLICLPVFAWIMASQNRAWE